MHRDLKLGLALAVLLIGSTTAFFFRGNTDQSNGLPELETHDGHGTISARSHASDFEEVAAENASDAESHRSPWTKPAFLNGTIAAVSRSGVTPDPIPVPTMRNVGPEEASTSNSPREKALAENLIVEVDGHRFHVVQPGDTLSGLAARYLGSIARFEELYELNRDVLRGPHDLKIGMKLRLPHPRSEASAATPGAVPVIQASANSSISVSDPQATNTESLPLSNDQDLNPDTESTEPRTAKEKLFVPAKKTPFIPSRYRAPKNSAAADSSMPVSRN